MKLWFLIAGALLVTAGIYTPGLQGGFVFDDYANIVDNHFLHVRSLTPANLVAAAQSGMAGPTMRPLSMVSFALNHYVGGLEPIGYKLVNLLLHGINGLLVFALVSALLATPAVAATSLGTRRRTVAAALAAVWLVHPLHVSTVLYVVQRMNQLATLFMFMGVFAYLRGRLCLERGAPGYGRGLAAMLTCTILALACKENGALIPLLAGVCEVTLFRSAGVGAGARRIVDQTFLAILALPALALAAYLLTHPEWLNGIYAIRPFTLTDRLLTEARALWFYVGLLILPDFRRFGLFHDDFALSAGWFDPATGALAAIAWVGVIGVAIALRRRAPVVLFGLGWFLAGHALESGPLPLEPVFEHRNYVPAIGPLLIALGATLALAERLRRERVYVLATLGFFTLCAAVTLIRADQWSDPVTHALSEAQYHPRSYRVNYELGRIYYGLYEHEPRPEHLERAAQYFAVAATLDPWTPLPGFASIQTAFKLNREPEPALLADVKFRLTHWPLHPNVVAGFKTLVDCQAQGRCRLPVDTVLDLFGVALENPHQGAEVRPFLLTQLASFYSAALADRGSAIDLMREVRSEYPNETTHVFNLMRLLIAESRWAQARTEAEAAHALLRRERNALKRHTAARELAALEDQIRNAAR